MAVGIYTVGIATKDRPELLKRCAESYIKNGLAHERRFELFVVDRSDSPATRNENKSELAGLRTRYRVPVFYAGPNEMKAFVARLENGGSDPEVCSFALSGMDGADKNAMLLDSAGSLLFAAGDSTVCEIARPPVFSETLRGWSAARFDYPYAVLGSDPTTTWPYPDKEKAFLANRPDRGKDVLGVVGADLGAEFRDLKKRFAGFRVSAPDLYGGRVRVVQPGILGDGGAGSSTFSVLCKQHSYSNLVSLGNGYGVAVNSGIVLRCSTETVVSDGAFGMPHAMAFDLTSVLPPFLPFQKNDDGMAGDVLFGALMHAVLPSARVLHLPWALKNDPPPVPRGDRLNRRVREAAQTRLYDVACFVVSEFVAKNPSKSYQSLAEAFLALGGLEVDEFRDFLCNAMALRREAGERFARRRRAAAVPLIPAWANDVDDILAAYESASKDPKHPIPSDLSGDEDEVIAETRDLMAGYGRLLAGWEQMFSSAKKLRMASNRLGIAL